MKVVPLTKGVDFAREERMEISKNLTEKYRQIFKGSKMTKYKEKQSQLQPDFIKLYEELYHFLIMTDRNDGGGQMELA